MSADITESITLCQCAAMVSYREPLHTLKDTALNGRLFIVSAEQSTVGLTRLTAVIGGFTIFVHRFISSS